MRSGIRGLVRRHPAFILGSIGLGVFLVLTTAQALAAPPGEPISQIEQQLVDAVNAERKKVGAPPLIVNYSLMQAAWTHNEYQARIRKIGHNDIGDGTYTQRIAATGYKAVTAGENVARGQRSVSAVMIDWMNSSGHRRNILNKISPVWRCYTGIIKAEINH